MSQPPRPEVACEVCRRKFRPRAGNQRRCADCRFGERLVVTLSRRAVEELETLEKTWRCSRSAVLDRLLRQRSPTMEEAEAEAIAKGWIAPEKEAP